jgi:hypothetical protein
MSKLFESPAFKEFLQKRCEEITASNGIHKELNEKLIELDKSLRNIVSPEAYKIFLEYESISIQQENNLINAVMLPR